MSVLLLVLGLLLFISLVVVHELGHFIVARRNGVEVEEFGIGFPPRLWKRQIKSPRGNYNLTINLLPLGGFVKLKGEHDADKTKGSFGAASLRAKTKIMTAGVLMNLATAFVLLTILAIVGIPKIIDNQFTIQSDTREVRHELLIGYVEPDSPASRAGLQTRDKLISLKSDDAEFQPLRVDTFPELTKRLAGRNVEISYQHGSQQLTNVTKLRSVEEVTKSAKTDDPKGYLGISPAEYIVQRSTWSAPVVAAGLIAQMTQLTFKGLGSVIANLFHGNAVQATSQVAGPVGIFVILKEGSLLGLAFVLMIIAVISLTLAIMNVLPIPALDGGRLFVTLLFRGIRRPLKESTEDWIHGTGFIVLMTLFVLITIVDVRRF